MAPLYDAIKRLHPGVDFDLAQDGTHNNEPYISLWASEQAPPSRAEIEAMVQQLQLEAEQVATDRQRSRQELVTRVSSTVSKKWTTELTAAQRLDVLGLVLFGMGVLDHQGRVRSLEQWLGNEECGGRTLKLSGAERAVYDRIAAETMHPLSIC